MSKVSIAYLLSSNSTLRTLGSYYETTLTVISQITGLIPASVGLTRVLSSQIAVDDGILVDLATSALCHISVGSLLGVDVLQLGTDVATDALTLEAADILCASLEVGGQVLQNQ